MSFSIQTNCKHNNEKHFMIFLAHSRKWRIYAEYNRVKPIIIIWGVLSLNKLELIQSIAEKTEFTQKDASKTLNALVETIMEELAQGNKVQIIGFGSFEVRDRMERRLISLATGQEIIVPANKVPAFKPGKFLKAAVAPPKIEPPVIVPEKTVKAAKKKKNK